MVRGVSFEIKDSGERRHFASGMVRDVTDGKINWALTADGPMLARWAAHMTAGAQKYDARNWMQAEGKEEFDRFRESAFRHFMQWYLGYRDEDHASAVFFNINGAEYVREEMFVLRDGTDYTSESSDVDAVSEARQGPFLCTCDGACGACLETRSEGSAEQTRAAREALTTWEFGEPDVSGCDGCDDPECGFVTCRERRERNILLAELGPTNAASVQFGVMNGFAEVIADDYNYLLQRVKELAEKDYEPSWLSEGDPQDGWTYQ